MVLIHDTVGPNEKHIKTHETPSKLRYEIQISSKKAGLFYKLSAEIIHSFITLGL